MKHKKVKPPLQLKKKKILLLRIQIGEQIALSNDKAESHKNKGSKLTNALTKTTNILSIKHERIHKTNYIFYIFVY